MKGLALYTDVLQSRLSYYTREHGRTDYTGQRRTYLEKDDKGRITRSSLLTYIACLYGITNTPKLAR